MCSGICCGFGADNSPQNQSEIDSWCAGQFLVGTAAHQYLHDHEAYDLMACSTYLEANKVGVGGARIEDGDGRGGARSGDRGRGRE
jgi:hypothetical protein